MTEHKGTSTVIGVDPADPDRVEVVTVDVYGPPGKAWPWRPGALDEPAAGES